MKILHSVVLFLISLLAVYTAESATYSVCSSGCDETTIQAVFDNNDLAPNDIVEIQDDGTYAEYVTWGSNDGGTSGNPVILRAAVGNSPTVTGTGSVNSLVYVSGVDYIQIGDSDGGQITFDPTTTGWLDGAIGFSDSNYNTIENNIITDVYNGNGIDFRGGNNYNTIQNNTVFDIGTSYFGSGQQGEGIHLYGNIAGGNSYNVIQNNTVYDCAHGNIGIYGAENGETRYNQILNNYVNSGRGELVSVVQCEYNLVDGNRLYNAGRTQTTLPKPAIQLTGGENNSIRNNIIYNGHHYYAFEVSAYNSSNEHSNDNYIYNNTIVTWGTNAGSNNGSGVYGGLSTSGAEITGNKYYNNIFWDINYAGQDGADTPSWKLVFYHPYYNGGVADDWGDNLTEVNASGCGGHEWKNNIVRSQGGAGYDPIINYQNGGYTYSFAYSLSEAETNLTNFDGNVEFDPLLEDSTPASPGASDTWWHLTGSSPAIDAGIVVTDANATIGGWSQPTYYGDAPDIGAYETQAADIPVTTVNGCAFGAGASLE